MDAPLIFRHALRTAALCASLGLSAPSAMADEITVFAAASLKTALEKIGAAWGASHGHDVVFSFAGSSTLAKQIQEGAPADIFMPASRDWMEALVASGDVLADTRRDVLTGSLVLIAHDRAEASPITLGVDLALAEMLGNGKLAMALVDAVPAGIYGKQALQSLGQWDDVQGQVVQAENVTGALQFVARGEADFGIVYASDARDMAHIRLLGTFPAHAHDAIVYPAAITRQSRSQAAAADFLDYLTSPPAADIWQAAGFGMAK
jgi:molybdate transport system substrate-binding protein